MKPITIDMKELSESTEIYEKKPNPAIVGFVYIMLGILVISVIWMACSEIDIVTEARGYICYTDDVSYVVCDSDARVVKKNVSDGQYVTEGTVLFELKSLEDGKDSKDDRNSEEKDLVNGQPVIRAKDNGYYYDSSKLEAGSVVQSGSLVGALFQKPQKTFQAQVVVEASDIGKIREGQQVRIEIEALPASEYGIVTGSIRKIAEEPEWDQENGIPYYQVWVEVDASGLKDSRNREVSFKNGFLCQAKIVTDRKGVLSYVWEYIR